mgnify:CR=1 FL=1
MNANTRLLPTEQQVFPSWAAGEQDTINAILRRAAQQFGDKPFLRSSSHGGKKLWKYGCCKARRALIRRTGSYCIK